MKLERSKEWWESRVRREGDLAVSAGLLAFDPAPEERRATLANEESRLAFGKFVHLIRRRFGFSVERLAREADLEPSEILIIEDNVHYAPEPRTVFQLAR